MRKRWAVPLFALGVGIGVFGSYWWVKTHYYPPIAVAIIDCNGREAVLMTAWGGEAVVPSIASVTYHSLLDPVDENKPPFCTVKTLIDQSGNHNDLTQNDKHKQPIVEISGAWGLRYLDGMTGLMILLVAGSSWIVGMLALGQARLYPKGVGGLIVLIAFIIMLMLVGVYARAEDKYGRCQYTPGNNLCWDGKATQCFACSGGRIARCGPTPCTSLPRCCETQPPEDTQR